MSDAAPRTRGSSGTRGSSAQPPTLYCPVSRAVEVLGERWTLLIVRDLLTGTTGFHDLIRGLPGLTRTTLLSRLKALEKAGVVEQVENEYLLTAAGRDLEPVVFGLARWGAQHAFGAPRDEEVDPALLLWQIRAGVAAALLPDPRTVLAFDLLGPSYRAWLVVEEHGTALRTDALDTEPDATVSGEVRALMQVWMGRLALRDALAGGLSLRGREPVVKALPAALLLSPLAGVVAERRD